MDGSGAKVMFNVGAEGRNRLAARSDDQLLIAVRPAG
jgi:hypothetical protein